MLSVLLLLLLIPFALSCRIFISLCLVLFVFCLLCVWDVCMAWGRVEGLCGGEMRGMSRGRTGCYLVYDVGIGVVWGLVERRCEWVFWVVGGLWRVGVGQGRGGLDLKSQ